MQSALSTQLAQCWRRRNRYRAAGDDALDLLIGTSAWAGSMDARRINGAQGGTDAFSLSDTSAGWAVAAAVAGGQWRRRRRRRMD